MRENSERMPRSVLASLVVAALALAACQPAPTTPITYDPVPLASWRTDGVGRATLLVGDVLYVGGDFTTVTSPDSSVTAPRANLAAFDVNTGALLTAFVADTNGEVRSLAHDGSRLFVGGKFTSINGQSRARLAALHPTTGEVDTSWYTQATGTVYALAVSDGELFVGGSFSTIANTYRPRLASFDLSTGTITGFAATVDGTVGALTATSDGSAIYIGGAFTTVNGSANPWLARLDSNGSLVPTDWEWLQGDATDVSLAPGETHLAVSQAGGGNQASYYDVSTGDRLWRQRCDGDAQAVHVIHGTVLGGFHEACEDDYTIRLTANDRADGARDNAFTPSFDQFWGVWDIDGDHSAAVIAGDFTQISGVAVQGFAIFPRLVV